MNFVYLQNCITFPDKALLLLFLINTSSYVVILMISAQTIYQWYIYIYIYIYILNRLIDQVGRVFVNCPGGLGSISSNVIPKTLKIVLT